MARILSSKINNSLLRAPIITMSLLPAALYACAMGYNGATPIPPPTHTTVPTFSMWVGFPKGPRIAAMSSPSLNRESFKVVAPTV